MKSLNVQIQESLEQDANDFEIAQVFKTYIQAYIKSIDLILENTTGKDFFLKHTKNTDEFLTLLYKFILKKKFSIYQPNKNSIPLTLIALGSYGREQLCIYSDIDLLILYEDIPVYNLENIIEEFITLAWDCGLKLGSRVHEISKIKEEVKSDVTIKTSIIESRVIYGSKRLWFKYQNNLNDIKQNEQLVFVQEKMQEHKNRLLKYPLCMQINVKDGYGGIREANMVFWMANIIYGVKRLKDLLHIEFTEKQYSKYRLSLDYIFQVRNHLHNIAKKQQDTIRFEILPELSCKLGFKDTPRYTKERQTMAKVFESLHNVHFFTTIMVKKFTRQIMFKKTNISKLKKFRIKKNIFIVKDTVYASFHIKNKDLNTLLEELILLPANIKKFDRSYIYHVSKTILPLEKNIEYKQLIKKLLYKEFLYPIIKLLYNAKLFSYIFSFAKLIINQPQFDAYHELPVDIHSISALKQLNDIKDENVKKVYDNLSLMDKSLLRFSIFFHDVGKGRSLDHHNEGASLFKKFSDDLNFDVIHIQKITKLIKIHNMMSKISSNEDIYSEKVILNFVNLVQNKECLDLLYVLTYADISAVGKNIYNDFVSILLRDLYSQTIPAFDNLELLDETSRRIAKLNTIKKLARYKELSSLMKKKITYISSNQLFLQLKAADILDLSIKAKSVKNYMYKILNEEVLIIRIIRSSALNLGYLLGKLEFLDISHMNIFKLFDEKKCFEIKFTQKINESYLSWIEEIINESFDMGKIAQIKKPYILKNEVEIECNHTQYLASLRIKSKNQKGLLAFITKILDDFSIEIRSAKLYISRGKVRNLFLIEKNGNFCINAEEITNTLCQNTKI